MNLRVHLCCGCLVISILFLEKTTTFAQPINNVETLNSDKGLSQNSVYSICKDSKGFLWIGTGDGLNRYDGKEFVVIRNATSKSRSGLKGFSINYSMGKDNRNNLWFSTERNLVKFNLPLQTFSEIIPFNDSLHGQGNKTITHIDTTENTIWFITPGECLVSYNYSKETFHKYSFPFLDPKKNLFLNPSSVDDRHGKIWLTCREGLFAFDKKKHSWKQFFKSEYFKKISIDVFGRLWLLNDDSLWSFDPKAPELKAFANHPSKKTPYISITSDADGKIWVGTLGGKLYYASAKKKEIDLAGDINKLSGSKNVLELRCLYVDDSGLLWIGTEGGGVIKINLNPPNFCIFPSLKNHPADNSLYVKSVFCDDDGKVWLGTFKKGVYILDPETSQASKFNIPANENFHKTADIVYSITKDNEGVYWLGYEGCLIAYNKTKHQFFFHQIPKTASNLTPSINQVSFQKGHMLLSTTAGLYMVIKHDGGKKTDFKMIVPNAVMESLYTSDGTLWISSVYLGLIKIPSFSGTHFTSLFPENGFRCLREDSENKILWAASQMGLLAYHLPSGKYKLYDDKNGLLNPYLYGVILNGKEIWVSSNEGIARGNVTFTKGETFPEIAFKAYTKDDGLQSNEFNTGGYALAKNGNIFFAGINGVNWFSPKNISTNRYKPKVSIISLKINDISYSDKIAPEYLHSLTTSFSNNSLSIKFIGLEFSNPNRIHYKFKLEGLDKNWITAQNQNTPEVRYANLQPGKYIFRILAANSDNVWSDEEKFSINILPPFYSTWWFRFIMGVIVVSSIISITRMVSQYQLKKKIRHLEKQKALEDERQRIAKEMHDDLGAGLTQISLISESAKRNNAGRFPADELNDISETSKQLIENVSEIIWAMNPEFDTLESMIAYSREQISKLLEYSAMQYHICFPEKYSNINIENSTRKNISMLLKEAVNNAIKHSDATTIWVKMILENNQLEIIVKDNGHGFSADQVTKGHGLKNYLFRTSLLKGTAKVRSGQFGTEVHFKIPLPG